MSINDEKDKMNKLLEQQLQARTQTHEQAQSQLQIKVIIYVGYVYDIGGIESWIYYMCQHFYKYYDILLLFDSGNIKQLKRYNEYVKVENRNRDKTYKCDVLLIASNWSEFPRNIKYKKCITTIHSDYKYFNEELRSNLTVIKQANEIVCVSQKAADSIYELFGLHGKVISNILGNKKKVNKILHLVSFSRLSQEKGYDRICCFAKLLKDNNIKFDWKIFSDIEGKNLEKLNYPEIIFMEPTLDVYDYIADVDYLVQLSDSEAFCYSVHEALQYGTPVIVTDIDVFKNVVINGYNGYKFKLDMSNVDKKMLDKIVNHVPGGFAYNENFDELENKWFEVLGEPIELDKNKDKNKVDHSSTVKIEIIEYYHDNELDKDLKPGDIIEVDNLRAYELSTINNDAHIRLGKILNE